MRTHAKKVDGGWILNGSKIWITNGGISDIAVVWARTEQGIQGFLLEKGMEGFKTLDIFRKFSLRASVTSEIFFDDVRVPPVAVTPHPAQELVLGDRPVAGLDQVGEGLEGCF